MPRIIALALASMLSISLLLLVPPGREGARAQGATGAFASAPIFNAAGQASVVFLGGDADELESAALGVGASGVWAQDTSGTFRLLVVGGPAFLKDAFRSAFPAGFPGATAVSLTRAPGATVKWTPIGAPSDAWVGGGDWIAIDAPGGKTILAEVFRPAGAGPFPVVVLLHGQAGFSNTILQVGPELARAGFVTVVGCWFAGNYVGTSNAESPTPASLADGVACPNGPTLKPLTSTAAIDDVVALIAAARTLPDVRGDRVGLVGNSRGSITALLAGSSGTTRPQAIGAIAGAPPGAGLVALGMTAPVLLLHGEADTVLPVSNSRSMEVALGGLGRPVQAHYYPGAPHEFFFDTRWHDDALTRLTTFLRSTLTP